MKLIYTSIAVMSFACGGCCAHEPVRGFEIVYKIPIPKSDGRFDSANTCYHVYYKDDVRLYKLFYMFDSVVNQRIVNRTERSFYFVFQKDSSFGRTFYPEPIMRSAQGRLKVDSVLKAVRFESSAFDTFAKMVPDSVIKKGSDLVKVYQVAPTIQFPEKFIYRFYYSIKDFANTETFSKAMDNIPGRKLYRICNDAGGGFWPGLNQTLPPREIVMEMLPARKEDKIEVMKYFKKYQKADDEDADVL